MSRLFSIALLGVALAVTPVYAQRGGGGGGRSGGGGGHSSGSVSSSRGGGCVFTCFGCCCGGGLALTARGERAENQSAEDDGK